MTIAGSLVSISEFIYAFTGTVKCALFNDNGSNAPGTVIATSSTVVTNPTGVSYIFAFTGVTLAVGQKVWLGFCPSTASTNFVPFQNGLTPVVSATVSYASFPVANPTVNAVTAALTSPTAATFTITPINSSAVNDPQQDATTSYVYDSTPGDADFYNIGTIATSAPITLAVTTRGYMQKSDVGGRTAAVQIKSGATTVASPTLTLTTSGWQWAYRTDIVDPNTGSAWTAAAVAAAQVGPVTVS
jgi:hypothetical protein